MFYVNNLSLSDELIACVFLCDSKVQRLGSKAGVCATLTGTYSLNASIVMTLSLVAYDWPACYQD